MRSEVDGESSAAEGTAAHPSNPESSDSVPVEMCRMDKSPSVQNDPHLIAAGECFMFLSWVQSAMCDLLALEALGPESRTRYNTAHKANDPWPTDFSNERLTLSKESFGSLKNRFVDTWPQWSAHAVHDAIERVVLLRNAIGHAQVQLNRPYLLYVPEDGRWPVLESYFTCGRCGLPLNSCACEHATPEGPPPAVPRAVVPPEPLRRHTIRRHGVSPTDGEALGCRIPGMRLARRERELQHHSSFSQR